MAEVDESRKRKHHDDQKVENALEILPFSDGVLFAAEDDGGDVEDLEIEEEMVIAVMKRLEEEISSPSPSPSPSSRFLNPRVSIGGGSEESCGSSFSDSASTVMASVDGKSALSAGAVACLVGGTKDLAPVSEAWPWAVGASEAVGPSGSEVEAEENEDEWLARVLGGPGFEWEECFL